MTEYLSQYTSTESYLDYNGEKIPSSTLCIGLTPLPVITWHPSCGPSDISAQEFAQRIVGKHHSNMTGNSDSDANTSSKTPSRFVMENKSPVIGMKGRFMEIQTLAPGCPYLCQYIDLVHLSKGRSLISSVITLFSYHCS